MTAKPARRSRMLFALLAVAPLGLAACGDLATSGEINRNQTIWTGKQVTNYEYQFRWSCFCSPEFTAPARITVTNGQITAIADPTTGAPIAQNQFTDYRTIDGLFDYLHQAVARNADEIIATYDQTWGYPREVSIDYVKNAADDEMAFTASDLVAK